MTFASDTLGSVPATQRERGFWKRSIEAVTRWREQRAVSHQVDNRQPPQAFDPLDRSFFEFYLAGNVGHMAAPVQRDRY